MTEMISYTAMPSFPSSFANPMVRLLPSVMSQPAKAAESDLAPLHMTYWMSGGSLSRPIQVDIGPTSSPDIWFAEEPNTGIFGYGADQAAAVTDLRDALEEHLLVLRDQERLSVTLAAQLAFLDEHLTKQAE